MQDGRGSLRSQASASSTARTDVFQDPHWTYSCVKLQVENVVFSVPKHRFLVSGSPFKVFFSGWDGTTPIALEGISTKEFRAFLSLLYPEESPTPTSTEEWLGALRLSNKWNFEKIRNKALTCLNTYVSVVPAHTKISLGQRYLNEIWLRDGLVELVHDRSLSIQGLGKPPYSMTPLAIAQILYVQSQAAFKVVRHMETWHVLGTTTCNCGLTDYAALYSTRARALVDKVFENKIKAARYVHKHSGQATTLSSSLRHQSSRNPIQTQRNGSRG